MPRILLVDDEPLVTRTLQTLILDAMPDIEVSAVDSPAEALTLLTRNMYDVVVTDVAMPRISGLELLEKVKALWPMCYVIVLTAYDSFDYAYRASQYEDVRFILKIEPPEVILDAVRKGLEKVQMYFSASRDNERVRRYMSDAMPLLRQTLLERLLIFGEDLPDRALLESCGINIEPGADTYLAVTGSIDDREKQHEILFLVTSSLRDRGTRADAMAAGSQLVFLIQAAPGDAEVPGMIRGQLDRIIEGAGPAAGLSFAVSAEPVPWEDLRGAVLELQRFAGQELERSRIVLTNTGRRRAGCVTLGDALRWRTYLQRRDTAALTEDIRACLTQEGYPRERQACATLIQMQLRDLFGAHCLDQAGTERGSAETVLFHGSFDTLDAWLHELAALIGTVFDGGAPRRSTEADELIDSINRYIDSHFGEEISLTQIADAFNYNSSYLSRIYKQKMREGLNEHITHVRIAKACLLLRDSLASVGVIAEQCGFQTAKYFITVFKRGTGMTPKAWRENNINE